MEIPLPPPALEQGLYPLYKLREPLPLPEDVPYLELAVYGGDYYVSFPPVPSLLLLPLTFFFGMDTPDSLLIRRSLESRCTKKS